MSFFLELKSVFCDKNSNLLFILPVRKWSCVFLFTWLIANVKTHTEHLKKICNYYYNRRAWLRHCATSRGSQDRFPVVSLGIFSVAPPTEKWALNSRDFSWSKGGRCVWLTTYHPCSAETSIRNPLGHLGLLRETFTSLLLKQIIWNPLLCNHVTMYNNVKDYNRAQFTRTALGTKLNVVIRHFTK